MAILNKDDFFNEINARIGTDTSAESIKFIEDMTDTYNHLEQKASADKEDWEQKYKDLDESWKKKYKARFFSGGPICTPDNPNEGGSNSDPSQIKIDDLFKSN